ncbi:Protein Networked (NET), actin-binding (NAB) domain [Dillenia turbinata]|uniref:Protein Networked (NET), actin-binding (NAB) domain n=1 Tax=Dillenia turbinata TaxID=194707 RepID=A0AAN8ZND5_9MAGN
MLQRAASNAYSWWWASHIRTKQSKWMEQNLQDMDEKVEYILKIIDDDGDSFAKRAEMYYKKRPELINFVEESYRAYRALAERYDHLSRELQNANRTIATVFPEQVELSMDDDDEENLPKAFMPSGKLEERATDMLQRNPSIPKAPKIPAREFRAPSTFVTKKGQLKRMSSSAAHVPSSNSGLSKTEALEEIDKLQKGILVLQTEKEFVRSSYETAHAKYWEIEKQITEMQQKVCSLQDEFGIGTMIEDDEARSLMASTALKSCQEALKRLQEKQKKSAEEAKVEYQRIREAHEKFATVKHQFGVKHTDEQESRVENSASESPNLEQQIKSREEEKQVWESFREQVKQQLAASSNVSLTMTEMAEKIDELVNKVMAVENVVSSQTALVNQLRSETDDLQSHLCSLEEEKVLLAKDSDKMSNKVKQLEAELHRVHLLNHSIADQNKDLQTRLTEASCNLDHLSQKLDTVKPAEELKSDRLFPKRATNIEKGHALADSVNSENLTKGKKKEKDKEGKKGSDVSGLSDSAKAEDRKESTPQADSDLVAELKELGIDEEGEPNWKQLFLNVLEDREKILVEEYTATLRKLKEVKKKHSEIEKKNRDSLHEMAMQLKDLRYANAMKDEEIQSLKEKLKSSPTNSDENCESSMEESRQSAQRAYLDRKFSGGSFHVSDHQSPADSLEEQTVEHAEKNDVSTTLDIDKVHARFEDNEVKTVRLYDSEAVSATEEKLRGDIDDLLEENLDFWLRFSTSFHQVKKFQSSVQDLQSELENLREVKRQVGHARHHSLKSDAKPIYKHLREIQTELALWLEHNSVLRNELQCRLSSICNIQEEIARVSDASFVSEGAELSNYQAAKFQGEVLNMKQENNKVDDELQAGLKCVRMLQAQIEKLLSKLDEEFDVSETRSHHFLSKNSSTRPRIPLRSFLFGVKLKKQKPSLFSCVSPLQKQYSDLANRYP